MTIWTYLGRNELRNESVENEVTKNSTIFIKSIAENCSLNLCLKGFEENAIEF